MNLYFVGVALVMGMDIATMDDKEPDTFKNAFGHLMLWLFSWVVVGWWFAKSIEELKEALDE